MFFIFLRAKTKLKPLRVLNSRRLIQNTDALQQIELSLPKKQLVTVWLHSLAYEVVPEGSSLGPLHEVKRANSLASPFL